MRDPAIDPVPARRRRRVARFLPATVTALILAGCASPRDNVDYAAYEAALRALGDLRTDTAPVDAPFSNEDLVRNFARIALRHEADIRLAGSESNAAPNPLQRWERPIRYSLFGSAATLRDMKEVDGFMGRIGRLTGLPVVPATTAPNLIVLITSSEERDAVQAALNQHHPALGRSFALWRSSPEIVCAATNLIAGANRHEIVFGLIMIGEEVRGLLRQSCLHEEITQALGLGNDHPAVRPSIFNDDEEFALLTLHDQWLIRLLYDQRLSPGMTEREAVDVLRRILPDLRPSGGAGDPRGDLPPPHPTTRIDRVSRSSS
ncbi:MAG: DUF2927 domain-containing protein [Pseudomonadota bacterium]